MEIPFDNNSGEKYAIDVVPSDIEVGDGIFLTLNKKACEAFAKLFSELAKGPDGTHIHLGYDESEPQGPGFRLVINDNT
ncbi:hypothetical protein KW517_21960 [Vibrio fluvialis]|nr:hypothetical protein [Vibrio fluvialis]HCK0611273.1 hypothetical protein [Vibrio parahaemolyticus]